ncbi:hypothetical protein BCR42DRAFT_420679 [Absidia repens]|uniref:Uncharacterized protein n=1 Tax=Absidia repens TaxID=90262 RepID=A0A1X2I8L1_9FUNG|nr:hypothetical protein BCR42DRAFT_420679 [Absidia repens]
MDQVSPQSAKQAYSYFYQQAMSFNITILPSPDKIASAVGTVGYTVYQNCPANLQVYFSKFASLPLQTNVLPVFLVLVILYILFSLIMATLRGVFRLVYNFVRFTLILCLIITLITIAQQYQAQDSSLLQFVFDGVVQLRDQYVKNPPSSM